MTINQRPVGDLMLLMSVDRDGCCLEAYNAQVRLNKLGIIVLYLVLIQFCIILLCKSVSFPGLITKK